MFEKVFWFAVGFLVARYVIYEIPDYKAKEAEKLDQIRNNVHDLIKKYVPTADDAAIGKDVITIIPEN